MSTPFSNICFPFQYHLKDKLTLWEKKQTSLIRLACCRATMHGHQNRQETSKNDVNGHKQTTSGPGVASKGTWEY